MKKCNRCNQDKDVKAFYKSSKGDGYTPYCITCTREQVILRQRYFKKQCVDYKGGKCSICRL